MNHGMLIKLLRTTKHIKQKTICKKLGISQQAYSLIENKEYIEKEMLQKILAALQTTPEAFEALKKILSKK